MRGRIFKRYKNSNTWYVTVDVGLDPKTGKRKQIQKAIGSKKDAEKYLAELMHQVDIGGFVKPSKLTVAEFLQQWIRDYVSTNVRPTTAEGYNWWIEKHIIPAIGKVSLIELQPSHIQAFYRKCLENGRLDGKGGLSARSVVHTHRIIYDALSHAVKWGLVARNVAQAVNPPRAENRQMQTLDIEGVNRLLEASKDTMYYPVIHLAVYTGMRRSELLGLRWCDIDLDNSALYVVQVLHQLSDGRIVFQEPKSQRGRRKVSLSQGVVTSLREYKNQQENERLNQMMMDINVGMLSPDDLVFSNSLRGPLLPSTVTHAFLKIARGAGLYGMRLHDLRHTHASLMLRQGEHPKIVSERLGHSTVGITLDTYSHVLPGLQEAAAQRFEEGLTIR